MAGTADRLATGPLTELEGSGDPSGGVGVLTTSLTAGRAGERDAAGAWTTGRLAVAAGGVLAALDDDRAGAGVGAAAAVGTALDATGTDGAASWRPGVVAHAAASAAAPSATAAAGAHRPEFREPEIREPDERNNKMPASSVGAVNEEGDA